MIIGKEGKTAAITLVGRQSGFTMILALPQGKSADQVADVLIDHVQGQVGNSGEFACGEQIAGSHGACMKAPLGPRPDPVALVVVVAAEYCVGGSKWVGAPAASLTVHALTAGGGEQVTHLRFQPRLRALAQERLDLVAGFRPQGQ